MAGYIYLASPYTSDDPAVMNSRYEAAAEACAYLVKSGIAVYSPIVHWHHIAVKHGLPRDYEFWSYQTRATITNCCAVYILMIDGYAQSKGIRHEIMIADRMGIAIWSMTPYLDAYKFSVWGPPPNEQTTR